MNQGLIQGWLVGREVGGDYERGKERVGRSYDLYLYVSMTYLSQPAIKKSITQLMILCKLSNVPGE